MKLRDFLTIVCVVVFGIFMYALTVRGVPGDIAMSSIAGRLDTATQPFELSPERGRYILTYSLAERGTFALNKELGTAANPDVGYYEGNYFIYFAPGVSVLALPMYFAGKYLSIPQVGAFFTVSLFATVNLLLVYIVARKLFKAGWAASVFAALVFGFASTSWSYAITLYQHHVTTFFILSSLIAAWSIKSHKKWRFFAASYIWIVYGLALFVDYPNMFLLAPIVGYMLYSFFSSKLDKKVRTFSYSILPIVTGIFFAALIGLHGYYNYVHFGSPTKLSGTLVGFDNLNANKVSKDTITEDQIATLAAEKADQAYFQEEDMPRGFAILTGSRDRGILLYSPIYILAFLGVWLAIQHLTTLHFFVLATVFANFFVYSSWGDPWGGWAFGPRYLIPSMALLSPYVALLLTRAKQKAMLSLTALVLFSYSAAISLLGALTTNQVPPKVEADFLKLKYNFLLNLDYLLQNQSGSYVYKTFLQPMFSLSDYYVMLLIPLLIIAAVLLIISIFEKYEH